MTKPIYSWASPGARGLAIDWETSGSDFTAGQSHVLYQGISFGAVIFDSQTLEPLETLYRELHFDDTKYQWSTAAQDVHGLSREHLAEHGVSREEALVDLLDLILRWIGPGNKVQFLGHNAQFDIDFTQQLAGDFGVEIVPHHVVMETSGAAYILTGKYRSNDVFEIFTGTVREKHHNALDDALLALEVCRNMRAIYNSVMES